MHRTRSPPRKAKAKTKKTDTDRLTLNRVMVEPKANGFGWPANIMRNHGATGLLPTLELPIRRMDASLSPMPQQRKIASDPSSAAGLSFDWAT
jgi:hypothetical protein